LHIDGGLIGQKRNFGSERADGEVIAVWDDDDYSAPGRLADQIGRLQESGNGVTGYHSMRFTDGQQWWQYRGEENYALGTSLCYRRDWWKNHPFKSVQVGEDNGFVADAVAHGQLISVDARELMYATVHNANTSPRCMGAAWEVLT
jgi:glycosyltransferase involved in cell wall biosynthesis